MGRWRWVVVLGMVGWVACGTAGHEPQPPGPTPSPGETLHPAPPDASPSPSSGDGGQTSPPPEPDAGTPDAGTPDAGTPDAGPPDAGLPDVGSAQPGAFPAVQPRLPTLHLKVAEADLRRLEANPYSDDTVPVEVELDGHRARGQIRYRGASSRDLEQKSYKIELDPGYELEDRDHFHLLASYNDAGKLTEKFAVDLFFALGLPVPRARYVTVRLNGEHQGLYLDMEHVGKDYLKHHRMERGASVYRCGHRNCELTLQPGSYQSDFEKKTNEGTGRADLDAFLQWVNHSDAATFEAKLAQHVDLEAYLGNLAADALISNAVVEDSRSYWIHELGSDVWTYVPWDLNNARMLFWRTWDPSYPPISTQWPQTFSVEDPFIQGMWETRVAQRPEQRPTWSVLNSRIWDRPALRERVLDKLEAALTTGPFTEARAHAHIDALWKLVGPALAKDPYASPEHVRRAPGFLKQYVRERRQYLLRQLATLRALRDGPLVIRELASGEAGYVELYNPGSDTLSLDEYAVTNDLRNPLLHRLPAGLTLGPGQSLRLLADGSSEPGHLPFTLPRQGGEVGLFDATRTSKSGRPLMYGPQDAVWFGPLPSGTAYGRKAPTSEDFERRPASAP